MSFQYIKENLEHIQNDIHTACEKIGKNPDEITLIGVTKTVEADVINASIEYGVTHIGENKVQEITRKKEAIKGEVKIHLIGHLQTNKVKYIIGKVHLIHSVDSLRLAEEISKKAKHAGVIQNILVQINIAEESTKFGASGQEAMDLVLAISKLENIKVLGLMNIAPFDSPEEVRPYFKKMKEIFDEISKMHYDNIEMKYLSMGMSNDFAIAIEEGANMLRIGTSIYGKRHY